MSVLIGATAREHVPELLAFFGAKGILAKKIGEISRVLVVDVDTPDYLPPDTPYHLIQVVEDSKEEYQNFSTRQFLSIPQDLASVNWGPARVIRRKAPWNVDRMEHPIETFFHCERDGTGVDYYLPDSGCRTAHVEFGGRASIIYEPGATANGDVWGHGTECASLAVGATVGIARGATLFAARGQDNGGSINAFTMANALQACLDHYLSAPRVALARPAVCSLSFGKAGEESVQTVIIEDMIDAGIVVTGACGNNGTNGDFYPAQFNGVLACGGTKANDTPLYLTIGGTNWASWVRISAPCENNRTAKATGNTAYGPGSGTSYAAPVVAGVIACMLQGLGRRLTGRDEVLETVERLLQQASPVIRTAGQYPRNNTLNPRLVYLDPRRTTAELYDPADVDFDAVYPTFLTTLQNPSFESGMTSWTEDNSQRLAYDAIAPATEVDVLPTIDGGTGVCNLDAGYPGNQGWVLIQSSRIGIPQDKVVEANAVGGETITVTCGARSSISTATPSRLRGEVSFYDGEGFYIGKRVTDFQTLPASSTAWQTLNFGPMTVPRIARSFAIRLYGECATVGLDGNQVRIRVDAVSFAWASGPSTTAGPLNLVNANPPTSLTGWTVVNGNWARSTNFIIAGARLSTVVGHTVEIYQDVAVQSGLYSRVDGGLGRLDFFWNWGTYQFDPASGKVILSFRDNLGAEIGSRDSGWRSSSANGLSMVDTPVPAGTRTVRVRLISRWDGNGGSIESYYSVMSGFFK